MKSRVSDMIGVGAALLATFLIVWVLGVAPIVRALAG